MFSILLSAPKHRSHVHVQKNTWLNWTLPLEREILIEGAFIKFLAFEGTFKRRRRLFEALRY